MLVGNKILQKLFFCFKFDPENPSVANKIEAVSDQFLDAVHSTANLAVDAVVSIAARKGLPQSDIDYIKGKMDAAVLSAIENIDSKIGNEEVTTSGVVPHIDDSV